MKTLNKIFGTEGTQFFEIIECLIPEFSGSKYFFEEPEKFREILLNDPIEGTYIYWQELIGRFHFAAASSVLRSYRWVKGMASSYQESNYLSFAANYRGFIESASDSFDTLLNLPLTVAENQERIRYSLNKENPAVIAISTDMEDALIHFSHGRKLEKGESAPKSHKAKSVRGYLDILKKGAGEEVVDLYAFLCQVTHPAAYSLSFLLDNTHQERNEYTLNIDPDIDNIELLLSRFSNVKTPLMLYAFNPSMLSLKVINLLNIEGYHTEYIEKIYFENIPAWHNIKKAFKNSDISNDTKQHKYLK